MNSIIARTAFEIFVTPLRAGLTPKDQRLLGWADRRVVRFGNRQLAAWIWGKAGPAVLLVHDWDSRAAHLGEFVSPLVENGFRVVAFDAPGHGNSEGVLSSIVQMSRAILAVADKLGPFDGVVAHAAGSAAVCHAFANGMSTKASVHVAPLVSPSRRFADFAHSEGLSDAAFLTCRSLLEAFDAEPIEASELPAICHGLTHPGLLIYEPENPETPSADVIALHAAWPKSRLEAMWLADNGWLLHSRGAVDSAVAFLRSMALQPVVKTVRPIYGQPALSFA